MGEGVVMLRDVDHLLPPCKCFNQWPELLYEHDHEINTTTSSLGRGGERGDGGGGHVEESEDVAWENLIYSAEDYFCC